MSLCMGCMKEKGDEESCPHCGYLPEPEDSAPVYLGPGTVLNGRYLIGRVLGQGGFGITYIGFDQVLNTRVAVKEYYPADLARRTPGDQTVLPYTGQARDDFSSGREKFVEEARTLARFSDFPGIVGVRDCFEAHGTAYLVMQYLEGISLKAYLDQKGGTLPPEDSIAILTPVMDALKEVHKSGIIHRDISPDNIFITTEGQVKLIDFGAARQSLGNQSMSLSIMLKPGYAPEEQYRSHGKQGPWTDVYALSATLYRMVTGSVPPDSLERLSDDTLEIPDGLSEQFRSALQAGLAVREADRLPSVEQLQAALYGGAPQPAQTLRGKSPVISGEPMKPPPDQASRGRSAVISSEPMKPPSPPAEVPKAAVKAGGSKTKMVVLTAVITAAVCLIASIALVIALGRREGPAAPVAAPSSAAAVSTPAAYIPPVFEQVSASNITTSSASGRKYGGALAQDGKPDTAWNVPNGVGEWLLFSASSPQQVKGVKILNGYTKFSPDYNMWIYYANRRPKDITVSFSDGSTISYTLQDVFDQDNYIYQTIDFGGMKTTAFVKITIDSIYPGNKWTDTCISEVEFY